MSSGRTLQWEGAMEGHHQDNWLKGTLKQEMIRTFISLSKTASKGGVCSLEGGSDGKARPKRLGETQGLRRPGALKLSTG